MLNEKDLDICRTIRQLQKKLQWPKRIIASTGKNRKERVIEANNPERKS